MSGAIELAQHWCWATFDEVAEVMSDLVDPTLTPDAIHIAPNHIESWTGKILPYATVAVDRVTSAKNRFWPGQILYSKIRPYLAKAAFATFEGVCSADMYPVSAKIDAKYLLHWILTPWFTGETARNQGRTILPKINRDALGRMSVPVAPLNEQRRIVGKIEELFSDLDAGVAALERARGNLKRYRASVLKAAVEGALTAAWREQHPHVEPASELLHRLLAERRQKWEADQLAKFAAAQKSPPKNWQDKYQDPAPTDTTNLPKLPESWCWATLEAVAEVVGGITMDQKKANQTGMRDVPYLRVANVQRGVLDLSEMKTISASEEDIAALQLKAGDILFTEGGDRDKLGRGWVWSDELPECIHQNHIFRARVFASEMQPKLISHHGNSFGKEWFIKAGKQTTNLASINMGILRRFPIPIAPAAEQAEIVSEVSEALSQIESAEAAIERSLRRAARLRQSILKQAFAGKLVPQDPTDEPASQLLARLQATADNGTGSSHATRRTRTTKAKRSEAES